MIRGLFLTLAFLAPLAPAPADAGTATVVITKADCARLVEHVPAPDVAYQEGVDVYGRPVVPADLGGGAEIAVPEEIFIAIDVDLFDRFGIPPNGVTYDADAIVGVVRYAGDRFTFNGQPLVSEAAAALAERCQAIERGSE